MTRVLVLGDSHAIALAGGKRLFEEKYPASRIAQWQVQTVDDGTIIDRLALELKDGQKLLNPLLKKPLVQAKILNRYTNRSVPSAAPYQMVLLFGYSLMHAIGFHAQWTRHTVLGAESTPAGAGALPAEMIYEMFVQRLSSYAQALALLRASGFTAVSLLAGPPPMANFDNIERKAQLAYSRAMRAQSRLALYRQLNRAVETIAKEAGFAFRNYSDTVSDEDGFLKQPYWYDGVHANDAYGKHVLQRLLTDVDGGQVLPRSQAKAARR